MPDISFMGLRLIGWFREVASGEEKEPILYAVSGLTTDDNCTVGYAGKAYDGKKKWYLHWYRHGTPLKTPDVAYDSPEDALKAVAELKEKGI